MNENVRRISGLIEIVLVNAYTYKEVSRWKLLTIFSDSEHNMFTATKTLS